jgi:outer membrane protein assembly factor BamA
LSYDYSFRRIGVFERDLTDDDPDINNEVVRVARFNATLSRDTRDDILNATRGAFLSESLQMAPPGIGSSVKFVRNYSQYLSFIPVWRPRLIWASAYRLGLARSFGSQPLVQTDQFNAAESLRAFGGNSLTLQPGNALLVMNQELRHPLFWRFGVVGFWDIGNVYERVGNFRILEQRHSPGLGLRIDTPFALIRADWGFNVFPKPGESSRTLSFGIGQAF